MSAPRGRRPRSSRARRPSASWERRPQDRERPPQDEELDADTAEEGLPGGTGWRWRPFRLLAVTQAAHAAGDVLVAVSLANTLFFSVPLGQARGKVALYLLLTMAPFGVLAPFVGPWLDRRRGSYRIAIVAALVGRAGLAILLSSRIGSLYLYPLAFGLLVLSRVHGVSRGALVPESLPPGRTLMWANARLAMISVGGGALGAGPAVGLSHWLGPGAALWTAAVAFSTGALAAMGLPPARGERRRTVTGPRHSLLTPRLLAGGVAMAALRASVGFTTFLLALLLRAKGEGGKALALAIAAAAAGGLAGSVVAPLLRRLLHELPLLLATLLLGGAAAIWAATSFTVSRAALLAAVIGLAAATGRLAFDGLVQQDAPDQVRARTFARYESIFQLAWVAGAGLATTIPFGPAPGLVTLALICTGGALLAASASLRRRVTEGLQSGSIWVGRRGAALARSASGSIGRGGALAARSASDALRRAASNHRDERAPAPATHMDELGVEDLRSEAPPRGARSARHPMPPPGPMPRPRPPGPSGPSGPEE